jgi:hypothetical protein
MKKHVKLRQHHKTHISELPLILTPVSIKVHKTMLEKAIPQNESKITPEGVPTLT